MGWGTETRTLDSDSMKDIDACSLSLQPCAAPMVTPTGVLYDKQVLIEYILSRKKEIEREQKAWEAQQANDVSEAQAAAAAAHEPHTGVCRAARGLSQADLRARAASAGAASSSSSSGSSGKAGVVTAASMGRSLVADNGKHAADTSFWVVSKTPEARQRLTKPDAAVRCPISGEPLRLKAMTAVIFTPAEAGSSVDELVAKSANERYICPLSKKALSNVNPVTVLRPSGMAVS